MRVHGVHAVDSGRKLPFLLLARDTKAQDLGSPAFRGGNARSILERLLKIRPAATIPRGGPNFWATAVFDQNVKLPDADAIRRRHVHLVARLQAEGCVEGVDVAHRDVDPGAL